MKSHVIKVLESAVLIAMTMPAMSSTENTLGESNRAYVVSAVLSLAASLNFNDVVNIMSPTAKDEWGEFVKKTAIDGKQYLVPDFFKVKHLLVSNRDEKGYVLGMYNPFYDSAMLFLVEDAGVAATISGMKIVTGVRLRDDGKISEFPKTSGLNPPDEYIALLLSIMNSTAASFHAKFGGSYRETFKALKSLSKDEADGLMRTVKFRIAQVVKMSEDSKLKINVAFANAVLREPSLASGGRVRRDRATQRVIGLLSGELSKIRKAFQAVAYFPDDKGCNIIFSNTDVRSMLVHAHVTAEGVVWYKLLDMSLIGDSRVSFKQIGVK